MKAELYRLCGELRARQSVDERMAAEAQAETERRLTAEERAIKA